MIEIKELGIAKQGSDIKEIVIALSPAFGTVLKRSIIDLDLGIMLREICAGIEEEEMNHRLIKVLNSTDLAVIASQGSKLSGSGVSIGLQSRGTTVIHQRDLVPLDNLELFPQSPLYDEHIFRKIGKNAAKYAKGENPEPLEILNDYMLPATYLIKSTLLHFQEGSAMDKEKEAIEIDAIF